MPRRVHRVPAQVTDKTQLFEGGWCVYVCVLEVAGVGGGLYTTPVTSLDSPGRWQRTAQYLVAVPVHHASVKRLSTE